MSEKASGGQEVTEKPSEITKREEDAQSAIESKEKARGGATESIAVVRSKIREKNAVQAKQEEEGFASLKVPNITNSKISSKLAKHKRSKSKSNEALDTQDNLSEDTKSDNNTLPTEELQNSNSEYVQNESKAAMDMTSIVSKKSVMSRKSVAKSASRLIALTEDDDNAGNITSNVTSKISIGGNYENDESLSTFVIAHDAEPQKDELHNTIVENVPEFHQEKTSKSPVHIHERGNYMTSVSPSPLEEYPTPKQQKDIKEQQEPRELKEHKEQREHREQKEIKEQREHKEHKEQREQSEEEKK